MASSIQRVDQALAALTSGAPQPALEAASAQLALTADAIGWRFVRALALSLLKQPAQALPDWQRLCELQPNVAEHHANLGNCLLELGQYAQARQALDQAAARGDRSPATARGLAICLLELGEPQAALRLASQLEPLQPSAVELQLLLARIALALDDQPGVLARLDALQQAPLAPAHWVDWAYLNLESGRYPQAQAGFTRAAGHPASAFDAQVGAGLTAERSNRMDAAHTACAEATALLAGTSTAQQARLDLLRARLQLRDNPAAAVTPLQQLIASDEPPPRADPSLRFYLGRALDAAGRREAAATAFAEGHQLRHARAAAAHPALRGADDLLQFLDRPVPLSPHRPEAATTTAADPLFLVGFPRSGTTLLEQLLDAHPQLQSFDEQPFLQRLIDQIELRHGPASYPQALTTLDAAQIAALRARYRELVGQLPDPLQGVRLVDKNPLNMVRLPLVQAVFPGASVILALRHPCDVVLSCWMQDFRAPGFAFSFRDIAAIARMYVRVFDYFEHTTTALALPVHRLRYEDLVTDVRRSAGALFASLDLPWTEELLGFTERAAQRGAISTPSYAQVVQPVTSKAVGRWQHYDWLFDSATRDLLRPWCERHGYSMDHSESEVHYDPRMTDRKSSSLRTM